MAKVGRVENTSAFSNLSWDLWRRILDRGGTRAQRALRGQPHCFVRHWFDSCVVSTDIRQPGDFCAPEKLD
jgi:hypothetical protein